MEEASIKDTELKYICTFRYSSASVDKASVEPMLSDTFQSVFVHSPVCTLLCLFIL